MDADGNVSVPYLPRDFYEKVVNYSPEMAAYDQADLRSKTEIESMQD